MVTMAKSCSVCCLLDSIEMDCVCSLFGYILKFYVPNFVLKSRISWQNEWRNARKSGYEWLTGHSGWQTMAFHRPFDTSTIRYDTIRYDSRV